MLQRKRIELSLCWVVYVHSVTEHDNSSQLHPLYCKWICLFFCHQWINGAYCNLCFELSMGWPPAGGILSAGVCLSFLRLCATCCKPAQDRILTRFVPQLNRHTFAFCRGENSAPAFSLEAFTLIHTSGCVQKFWEWCSRNIDISY